MEDQRPDADGGSGVDPDIDPVVDVVLVSHNGARHLVGALDSLASTVGARVRPIVVDNASTDDSAALASRAGATVRVLETNVGYGAALNVGIELASAPWLVCANQDVRVHRDTIARLVSAAVEHDAACGVGAMVGPRLVTEAGETAETCHVVPTLGQQSLAMLFGERAGRARNAFPDDGATRHCGWVSAAFVLGRRQLFVDVGGFDPAYFMYVEDLDFFTRLARHGGHCVWAPTAEVVHARRGGGVQSPRLHAHTLWNWRRYYAEHSRVGGQAAGAAIFTAGIVGSLARGGLWRARALRGDPVAADHAEMFTGGALHALACLARRRPPAPG